MAPLVVITGPTASGKSSLAMGLAQKWGGEIVCADSRTVYRDMDIGTAKPTKPDQKLVKHWLLDVADPGDRFTVYDFQKQAKAAIADIRSRGKIPFVVGGTGLYIDSIVLDYRFGPDADMKQREALQDMTVDQLVELHKKQHIELPENYKNKRYLIRNIEKYNINTSRKPSIDSNTYVVAISTTKDDLMFRIRQRAEDMFADDAMQETQRIIDQHGPDSEAMTGNIYRLLAQVIDGRLTVDRAKEMSVTKDWQLAKRQLTWLKRHDWVQWKTLDQAEQYFDHILDKFVTSRNKSDTIENSKG